jgi:C-terminal processing protease CtpA/Prc
MGITLAAMLGIAGGASAQEQQAPAQLCKVGIGVQVTILEEHKGDFTAEEREHPELIRISPKATLRVAGVLPDSPATRATTHLGEPFNVDARMSLEPAMTILSVNGKPLEGMTMAEAVAVIGAGPVGSDVALEVRYIGVKTFNVKRDKVCWTPEPSIPQAP